jgi:opacity protein-like surface antigen
MKRLITLVTTLALVSLLAAPAQAQQKGEARFGLQGGVTSSSFTGDDVPDDQGSKTGFMAGVLFNYYFSQNWGIGVEGNWLSGVGAKSGSGGTEGEIKMSYFSFPLTLNFAFPLGEEQKTWLGLQGGISANLNLTCKEGLTASGATEFDCKDETESVAWAVPLGAGIGFQASDAAVVFLRARYQLGLSDTFSDDTAAKLNFWEFILGASFIP